MNVFLNLSLIYFQILILTFFLISSGFLFRKIFINSNHKFKFEEDGLFGFILIGFLSLFLNFFIPLSSFYNSLFFVLIILISLKNGFYKYINNDIFKKLVITSSICFLLLIYSNVNRPDAWLYHLPYSKIINEHKIILGVANIHERFAHISIFQYISSFFYNYIFQKNGILIPIALVTSFFFMFSYYEFEKNFKKKAYRVYSYVVFLFLVFSLYSFNRYSEYGNDAQAHIFYYFFILILYKFFLDNNKIYLKELSILSLFIFFIKPTFIVITLIPIFIILINKEKRVLKTLSVFFYSIFLFSWILKNFLSSGCLIYPMNITCYEKISWKNDSIITNSIENEAWSKGWPDLNANSNISQNEYVKSFNWINTWFDNHFRFILKKTSPILFFLIINFFIFYFTKSLKKNIYDIRFFYLFLFSLFFLSVWFLKFPLYRLGISQINSFLIFLSFILFIRNINPNKLFLFYKPLKFFLFLAITIVVIKNSLRIYENIENSISPNIFFSNQSKVIKVYNSKKIFTHYKPLENNLCGYSLSPCSHLAKNLELNKHFGYKIFYKQKP